MFFSFCSFSEIKLIVSPLVEESFAQNITQHSPGNSGLYCNLLSFAEELKKYKIFIPEKTQKEKTSEKSHAQYFRDFTDAKK